MANRASLYGTSAPLCYYHDDHKGDGRISLWCPVPPGVQEDLVSAEPERFFRPPMSARGTFSGWLGVFLDTSDENKIDWDEIAAIVEDAFRTVAPKKVIAKLDNRSASASPTRSRRHDGMDPGTRIPIRGHAPEEGPIRRPGWVAHGRRHRRWPTDGGSVPSLDVSVAVHFPTILMPPRRLDNG
jgi:hypothetical protein